MSFRQGSLFIMSALVVLALVGSFVGAGAAPPQTFYATNQPRTLPDGFILSETQPPQEQLTLALPGTTNYYSDPINRTYDIGNFNVNLNQGCTLGIAGDVEVKVQHTALDGTDQILIGAQSRLAEACALGTTNFNRFFSFPIASPLALANRRLLLAITTASGGAVSTGTAILTTPTNDGPTATATSTPDTPATQTAISLLPPAVQTTVAQATQTAVAALPPAVQTALAGATQTAIAGLPPAVQTALAGATQTAVAALPPAAQTALAGATQTAIAGLPPAVQTALTANATQTAIAALPPAAQTALAGATQTAVTALPPAEQTSIAQQTATTVANATSTAQAGATSTAQAAAQSTSTALAAATSTAGAMSTRTAIAALPAPEQTAIAQATATALAGATPTATSVGGPPNGGSRTQFVPFIAACEPGHTTACNSQ